MTMTSTLVPRSFVLFFACLIGACGDDSSNDPYGASTNASGAATTTGSDADPTSTSHDPTHGGTATDGGTAPVDGSDTGETTSGADDSSGSDPLAVCGADPCGGDVVGTWSYEILLCTEPVTIPSDFCPGGESTTYQTIEGTLELTADGTSLLHRRNVTHFHSLMPKMCLASSNCAAIYPDYECIDDGETCDCLALVYGDWLDEQTQYEVEGNRLVFHEAGGPEEIDYCATGGALVLIHAELGERTYFVEGGV